MTSCPPLANGSVPVTPVLSGKPVALVSVPLDGVPSAGVTKVGEVANTSAPLPVSFVTADARLLLDGVAKNVATPVPSPESEAAGKFVQLDRLPAVGVPSPGVIRFALVIVGDVEKTRFVLVVPVAPAAEYPVILLNAVMLALVAFVPPCATVTAAFVVRIEHVAFGRVNVFTDVVGPVNAVNALPRLCARTSLTAQPRT